MTYFELSCSISGNDLRLGLKDDDHHNFLYSPRSSSSSLSSLSFISSPLSPDSLLGNDTTEEIDILSVSSYAKSDCTTYDEVHSENPTSISSATDAPSIVLPREERFKHLRTQKRFAVDIGGTLVKVVYSSISPPDGTGETNVLLNFRKFQSIDLCVDFIKEAWPDRDAESYLSGTGGGSFKYAELLQKELGVRIKRTDEMVSLITGCSFLLRRNVQESFSYQHEAESLERYQYKNVEDKAVYPFLLVNIGTGISVLKVDSATSYSRVGGSTMGGGAFIGLGNLLTSTRSFDELLALAERGDHRKVDSLISDIYGGDYANIGLTADVIAGSFGKCSSLNHRRAEGLCVDAREEDIAKSLLLMISNSIGQTAFLYSNRFNVNTIYFGGFFIRNNSITMRTLSYAINYWSKGTCEALFLKHEGYLGAVGSFLDLNEEQEKKIVNCTFKGKVV